MKKGMLAGLAMVFGMGVGAVAVRKKMQVVADKKGEKIDKFKGYYELLNQWMFLKQSGKSLVSYFEKNGYQKIAIYGMGELGNRLYEELKDTKIKVEYAIDKNSSNVYSELIVKQTGEELPEVDVVIVTATFAFDEIVSEIQELFTCDIISLEDVVFNFDV